MTQISEEQKEPIRNRISKLAIPKEPIPTEKTPQLIEMPDIRAVYVDVYGTILISGTEPMMRKDQERNRMLLKHTFLQYGLPTDDEILDKTINGLKDLVDESHATKKRQGIDHPEVDIIAIWEQLIQKVFGSTSAGGLQKEQIPELLTDFVTRYDEPWLMPGLEDLMSKLAQKELLTGIISNSQFYTPLTLEALSGKSMKELGFAAEDCFWSYKEDIAKPSVRFYQIAADHLKTKFDVEPGEVLFVGNDMLNDILPASQIGFKTALFAGDTRSLRMRNDDKRCSDITPDVVITDLLQLLSVVS